MDLKTSRKNLKGCGIHPPPHISPLYVRGLNVKRFVTNTIYIPVSYKYDTDPESSCNTNLIHANEIHARQDRTYRLQTDTI